MNLYDRREDFVRTSAVAVRRPPARGGCGDPRLRGGSVMTWFPGLRSADRRLRRVLIGAVAIAIALVAVGPAAAITGRAAVAPSNASQPTTSGTNAVGSTITANPGTWTGSTPITFQYQWQGCDGNGAGCHDIAGATSQTYVLKADDAGNTLRVRTIPSNSDGSSSAFSAPTAKIATAGAGPQNTAPPTITGTATTGSTLTANDGTWSGTAPITFTY